jgi:Cft2 family RNA processing exonuclease
MNWDVHYRHGIWLPQTGWWLDAHFPVGRSFVSHAHSDHVAAHREILCSAGTARLLRARLPGTRVEHVLPFGHTEQLTGDTAVTLYPAGHMLGSAQCLLAHERLGALLYTGDFNLRQAHSAEPCATPRADVLIMETTFGLPRYVFPPADETLADIRNFCRAALAEDVIPVLFAYSLGKSQEIMQGLAASGLPFMLHPQTFRLTRVYEELGVAFPPYRAYDAATSAGCVVICPPQANRSVFLQGIPRRRTAVLTGWAVDAGAVYRYQCDAAFPLSDHAGFPDLLAFVDRVRPRLVYTVHGFAREFAQTLRARGLEAWALGTGNQLELGLVP